MTAIHLSRTHFVRNVGGEHCCSLSLFVKFNVTYDINVCVYDTILYDVLQLDAFNLTKHFEWLPFHTEHSLQSSLVPPSSSPSPRLSLANRIEYKHRAIYWEYIQWQRNHWLPLFPNTHIQTIKCKWMTPALILFPRIVFALCLFSISNLKSMKKSINSSYYGKKRKSHPSRNLLNGEFAAKHLFFCVNSNLYTITIGFSVWFMISIFMIEPKVIDLNGENNFHSNKSINWRTCILYLYRVQCTQMHIRTDCEWILSNAEKVKTVFIR